MLKRDDTKADSLEELFAYWLIKVGLGPNTWQWDAIYQGQDVKAVVPVWMTWESYQPPLRLKGESDSKYNDRFERYHKEWFGWTLNVAPTRGSAFLEYRRMITLATQTYEIPYVELATRYAGYERGSKPPDEERALMLKGCPEEFPYVRGGEQIAEGSVNPYSQKLIVRKVDDGVEITHHIEGINADGKGDQWHEVGSYPSMIGRPGLFPVTGSYNGAEGNLTRRYEPLDLALMLAYKNRDRLLSFLASHMASATPEDRKST